MVKKGKFRRFIPLHIVDFVMFLLLLAVSTLDMKFQSIACV